MVREKNAMGLEKNYLGVFFGLFSLLLLAVACTAAPQQAALPSPSASAKPTAEAPVAGPIPVIIDTDMGADDIMAILYLLQRPDARVQAITVSGTGLTHCTPGTRNALALLARVGAHDIPVACGRERPLQGNAQFPVE